MKILCRYFVLFFLLPGVSAFLQAVKRDKPQMEENKTFYSSYSIATVDISYHRIPGVIDFSCNFSREIYAKKRIPVPSHGKNRFYSLPSAGFTKPVVIQHGTLFFMSGIWAENPGGIDTHRSDIDNYTKTIEDTIATMLSVARQLRDLGYTALGVNLGMGIANALVPMSVIADVFIEIGFVAGHAILFTKLIDLRKKLKKYEDIIPYYATASIVLENCNGKDQYLSYYMSPDNYLPEMKDMSRYVRIHIKYNCIATTTNNGKPSAKKDRCIQERRNNDYVCKQEQEDVPKNVCYIQSSASYANCLAEAGFVVPSQGRDLNLFCENLTTAASFLRNNNRFSNKCKDHKYVASHIIASIVFGKVCVHPIAWVPCPSTFISYIWAYSKFERLFHGPYATRLVLNLK